MRCPQLILGIGFIASLTLAGCAAPKPTDNNSVIANPSNSLTVDQIESLAKALTAAGAKEYGSQFCSACKYQKQMFSEAWQFINYVECSVSNTNPAQNAACRADDVELYPTWQFADGSRLTGVQQFEVLAKKISFDF